MTIIRKHEKKCAVCGQTRQQPIMTSTSTLDYPDLDLRPAQMQRSSMFAWLDECPHCRYVARHLENELEASADILKTEEYLKCEGNDFKSSLAKRFYRHYMISKAGNDYVSGFFSLLHCAWICDDNDDELAIEVRKMALKYVDQIELESDNENNRLQLIKADLLRRTRQFDEVINGFKDLILEDKLENDVIIFQIELSMQKDSDCHTVREALGK